MSTASRLGWFSTGVVIALGTFFGNLGTAHAQGPSFFPAASIEPPTSTESRSHPLAKDFDVKDIQNLARWLTSTQHVPGVALAIVHDGRILTATGYGVTNVNNPHPVDAHTTFRLASLSKAFAGALTGLLVHDRTLRWNSKVVDYLPGFQLSDSQATQQLTITDLLTHQTGLPRNSYDREVEANADYYALTQRLSRTPLVCHPGSCYTYQNVAFSLIGDVVYAASGTFYEQAIKRRLFIPLGMNDASIGITGIEASPSWAQPHVRRRHAWVPMMPKEAYYRLAPAAGVNASASDMAQWLLAQTGHRSDIFPATLLQYLHTSFIATPYQRRTQWQRVRTRDPGYALGWRIMHYDQDPLIFHAGAVQGYRAVAAILPHRDFGVAILWNSEDNLPASLIPTILDRAIGLPDRPWLAMQARLNERQLAFTRRRPSRQTAQRTSRASKLTPH